MAAMTIPTTTQPQMTSMIYQFRRLLITPAPIISLIVMTNTIMVGQTHRTPSPQLTSTLKYSTIITISWGTPLSSPVTLHSRCYYLTLSLTAT